MMHVGMLTQVNTGSTPDAQTTPSQTMARHRLLPRDLATWNPRGCLVAVIEEPAPAALAALALRRAGFADADVCLADPREIVVIGAAWEARSGLARAIAAIRTPGDEWLVTADYAGAAQRGHYLLVVHAPCDELRRRAQAMLAEHLAHTMHYFGRWTVRGL